MSPERLDSQDHVDHPVPLVTLDLPDRRVSRDNLVFRVCVGCWDPKVTPEMLETLAHRVSQENREHRENADHLDPQAPWVLKETKDHQANVVCQVQRALKVLRVALEKAVKEESLENEVPPVPSVVPETKAHQDPAVRLDPLDGMVLRENLVLPDPQVHRENTGKLDPRVHRGSLVRLDSLDQRVTLDLTVKMVSMELAVLQDQEVITAKMETKELLVLQDHLANKGKEELVDPLVTKVSRVCQVRLVTQEKLESVENQA